MRRTDNKLNERNVQTRCSTALSQRVQRPCALCRVSQLPEKVCGPPHAVCGSLSRESLCQFRRGARHISGLSQRFSDYPATVGGCEFAFSISLGHPPQPSTMTIKILALCGFTQNATIYSKQVSTLKCPAAMAFGIGSALACWIDLGAIVSAA